MARGLGLESVAEGVETDEQAKLLKEMGCQFAQGYLYSKPISAEAFRKILS
jgi:EAL domain-containing protein (putative c-di-GMP-specific phosphodiesterase class I)